MTTAKHAVEFTNRILATNAALLGEPVAIKAVVRSGNIVLERLSQPGVAAIVLGDPDLAIEKAERAFLRAGLKAHGHNGNG